MSNGNAHVIYMIFKFTLQTRNACLGFADGYRVNISWNHRHIR